MLETKERWVSPANWKGGSCPVAAQFICHGDASPVIGVPVSQELREI